MFKNLYIGFLNVKKKRMAKKYIKKSLFNNNVVQYILFC